MFFLDTGLQFETVHIRHPDIGNQNVDLAKTNSQKRSARREGSWGKPG
ncbi:hypothetical protein AGRA671_23100 [Agrobacterium radiobacter]|nr:Uncharacterised protein [Agrobacterium tumefaciens]